MIGRLCWFAPALALVVPGDASPVGGGAPAPYAVVRGWPMLPAGMLPGSAAGVGVDSHGDVWVFHRAGRIWAEPLPTDPIGGATIAVFDGESGRLERTWGAGRFAMPHGLTIDGEDNVWLTDVALHQVYKFSPGGKLLLVLGERGVAGSDTAHFDRPTDVAVLPDGSSYVSDGYRNTRIAKFAPDGHFLMQWGRPGNGAGAFDTPHGIAADTAGRVYVADRENDRVQVFDGSGRIIADWRSQAMGRPYSLALLSGGRIAVVDGGEQPLFGPDRSGVAILDARGRVTWRFGRFGTGEGELAMGHDIAADAAGNLYVVDITGRRVQKFAPVPK